MRRLQEKDRLAGDPRRQENRELLEQETRNHDMIKHYQEKLAAAEVAFETQKKQFDYVGTIKELDNENVELIVSTRLNGGRNALGHWTENWRSRGEREKSWRTCGRYRSGRSRKSRR